MGPKRYVKAASDNTKKSDWEKLNEQKQGKKVDIRIKIKNETINNENY
jgi:hypothetical protein